MIKVVETFRDVGLACFTGIVFAAAGILFLMLPDLGPEALAPLVGLVAGFGDALLAGVAVAFLTRAGGVWWKALLACPVSYWIAVALVHGPELLRLDSNLVFIIVATLVATYAGALLTPGLQRIGRKAPQGFEVGYVEGGGE